MAKYIIKLLKYININNYIIKFKKNKQSFFKLIYSLKLIKLKILKIYIKINLINKLIKLFKSYTKNFIFFNKISNKNF